MHKLIYIQVMVESQHDVTVQPVNAEAYEWPANIAKECMLLAAEKEKPVTLMGKNGDYVKFHNEVH